ncbi:rhamnan synthesis F family protein [Agrobacterium rubi]|uniref:rhamnan synthesis F family protein n=1 Tax=Agrobacterium rubi TaxID=28099 RepID=UPI000A883539|nr:rhamnan synthesis F family protein [Agrobacterium rubi]MBP1881551.1 lipopolysaccharide biosynthesis protein [Agrobacterium rubi]
MKRAAITFFFDEHGIVDEYMFYLVEKLQEYVSRNVFVSNTPLSSETKFRLKSLGCEILERENVGFDVWAYKDGIEFIGYENLADYDELILLNHTFYGPIFPFKELFDKMDALEVDFWGISAHKEVVPNPFTNEGVLHRHLNSHFITVRGELLHSEEFSSYWKTIPNIESYVDSVLLHESRFTQHFIDAGYACGVYDNDEDYPSPYPCFINVDQSLERRCPILKRRVFFHDSSFLEQNAVDLPRALRIMRETSDYDEGFIWKNILRSANLRTLNTNAGLTKVFPQAGLENFDPSNISLKVAVCAHIYYTELLHETLDYASHITIPFDLIITTSDTSKKKEIEKELEKRSGYLNVYVLVVEENRGRDMSALFISCKKFFLDDRYDLVLRLHTKKSPQIEGGRGMLFKRHMLENIAGSKALVDSVLHMFASQPWTGVAVPPVVHISFPTMGKAWFTNKPRATQIAKMLDMSVKFDANTPIAAYGTMFWFRPAALRKLFKHPWKWADFNPEPNHTDGGLAHVLERLITYCSQDAGYTTSQILSHEQAEFNYGMLEYKLEHLSSFIPGEFSWQADMLKNWKEGGYPTTLEEGFSQSAGFAAKLSEMNPDYTDVVVKRLKVDNFNILQKICGNTSPPMDVDDHSRPDLHYQRDVCIETLMDLCGFNRSLASRFLPGSKGELVTNVRRDAELIKQFLIEIRQLPKKSGNQAVLSRHVLEYMFFEWAEGRELTILFDSRTYATNYLETETSFNSLVHYLTVGAKRLLNPHPLFDASFYMAQVAGRTVVNPLVDYVTTGWRLGLSPHPLFDTTYYLKNNEDVVKHGVEPLSHFLSYGGKEGRDPHWAFDSKFYLDKNPLVKSSGTNPLMHFILRGVHDDRWPNRSFDVADYRTHFTELQTSGENPLVHYVREAQRGR